MYKIIGADGKEYGPVSGEQLRMWIRDGRVNAHTRAKSEAGGDWQPLSAFPEFAEIFGITVPPPGTGAYAPPPVAPGPISSPFVSGSRDAALNAVKGPAISLIVVASIGILICLFGIVSNLLRGSVQMPPPANLPPEWQSFFQTMQHFQGPVGALINLFCAAMNGLVIFGAVKMMRLQSRAMAMVSCIVAMLPVTIGCCCVLGLPFGIWGLVVMNKPEVKSEFDKQ